MNIKITQLFWSIESGRTRFVPEPQFRPPVRPKAKPPLGHVQLERRHLGFFYELGRVAPAEPMGPKGPGQLFRLPSPGAGQLTGWRRCKGKEVSGLGRELRA